MSYKTIDISTLTFKDNSIPSNIALSDVDEIKWSKDVLDGKKKALISEQKEEDSTCAK